MSCSPVRACNLHLGGYKETDEIALMWIKSWSALLPRQNCSGIEAWALTGFCQHIQRSGSVFTVPVWLEGENQVSCAVEQGFFSDCPVFRSILISILTGCSVHVDMMLPPPCITVGMVFSEWWAVWLFLLNNGFLFSTLPRRELPCDQLWIPPAFSKVTLGLHASLFSWLI